MKRVDLRQHNDAILAPLLAAGVSLLPNTSGAKTAEEAVFAARLAREALGTHWAETGDPPGRPLVACPTRLKP
ncbi:thiazole biosynthesis protein ThiG [Klebsiella quasipneumoniae]|nr:thiazole biosynthesis protein ThiG [Klebsiella quasipneumoniae]